MVEAASARSGRGNHQSIENDPAALIGVEPITNEFAKKACALRIAIPDDSLKRRRIFAECAACRSVTQIGSKVADRGQSQSRNW